MPATERFFCPRCGSRGFLPSVTGEGCTFCDGTENSQCPFCGRILTGQQIEAQRMCDECFAKQPERRGGG